MKDTKEHIIIVSTRLFLEKNFEEVTTRDIVKATGLSKGAFYHHFESKEKLFKEVLLYVSNHGFKYNYEQYDQGSFYNFYHDFVKEVLSTTTNFLKILNAKSREEKYIMNLFTLYFDALRMFPDFKDSMTTQLKNELNAWKNAVSRARKSGEISTAMTDEQVARLFIHLNDGASLHYLFLGGWGSMKKATQSFLDIWDGLYDLLKK